MQPSSRHAVLAGFLGWTLDAFDFFVVVFLLDVLARQFAVSKGHIVTTLTATLIFRPVAPSSSECWPIAMAAEFR